MIYRSCVQKKPLPELSSDVMSIKLPLMTQREMQELKKIDGVYLLNQTNDLAAKQEREKGFCECITVGLKELPSELKQKLQGQENCHLPPSF